mgnify:CR=1 FL=1
MPRSQINLPHSDLPNARRNLLQSPIVAPAGSGTRIPARVPSRSTSSSGTAGPQPPLPFPS